MPRDAPANLCPRCLVAGGFSEEDPLGEGQVASTSKPHPAIPDDAPLAPSAPQRLGEYDILDLIARGGMGVVYKARHAGLDRVVAIKMIRSGILASPRDVERFQREARSAAKLHHPNIVTIHDIGEQDGQHYFSMDYVPGENLADRARTHPFTPRQAAEITGGIAAAIHYAHQQGVLHRDIKPANVILTPDQQPRILDFGLALILADDSKLTLSGTPVGSPSYMPPEQAAGRTRSIDARSDVYSLGAMLYELLTGRPPFQAASALETLQLVIECEPVSPQRLNPALPRDLETICLKCMEKDPNRRYQTAQELGDELGRFIRDEPILARPVSRLERTWRWCRRKPAVAALTTATILLLLAVTIGSPIATWRIAAARNAERLQRERAEANSDVLVKSLYAADMKMAWQALREDNLLLARASVYKYLPALGIPDSSGELTGSPLKSVGGVRAGGLTRDLLGWEWRHLWRLCQSDETFTLHGDGLEIRSAVFSPDSRLVVTARGQTVYVTDAHSKKQVATLGGFSDVIDNSAVTFSRDGKYLAAKGGTNVLIWQVGHWQSPYQRLQGAPNRTHGNAVLFSPDDGRFVTRVKGGLGVWDTATWHSKISPGSSGFGIFLNYPGNGEWLAVSEWEELKILNAMSLEQVRILHRPAGVGYFDIVALDSCPQRGLLAAGYRDGEVRLWEVGNWREIGSFQAHLSFAFGLSFSPDGNLLATGGGDQVIKFWDVTRLTNSLSAAAPREPIKRLRGHHATDLMGRAPSEGGPQPIKIFRGHHAGIHGLSFAPDGRSVVTASKDGTAKFWNPFRTVESDTLPDSEQLPWFSPDGARLITVNTNGRLHRWNTRGREDIGMVGPDLHDRRVKAWKISDDGERLAVGKDKGTIEIWNLKTDQLDKSFSHVSTRIGHLAFSRDAILLAAASERIAGAADRATLRIWDTASGAIVGTYTNAFGPLAFSSNGQRLVSTRLDGGVVVWDVGSGRSAAEIEENFTWIGSLALSPDGGLLVTGSEEPVVNLWDLATGRRVDSLKGNRMCIDAVTFTPDGRTIATRTVDNAMKFWNVATGKEIFTLGPLNPVHSFLFSPNGEYLAIAGDSGTRGERRVELWRAPSFEEIIAAEKGKQGKPGAVQ